MSRSDGMTGYAEMKGPFAGAVAFFVLGNQQWAFAVNLGPF